MYRLGLESKTACISLWEQCGLVAFVQAGKAARPQREGGLCTCLFLAKVVLWVPTARAGPDPLQTIQAERTIAGRLAFQGPLQQQDGFMCEMEVNVSADDPQHKTWVSFAVLKLGRASSLILLALSAHIGLNT